MKRSTAKLSVRYPSTFTDKERAALVEWLRKHADEIEEDRHGKSRHYSSEYWKDGVPEEVF